jgi:hypothetical protein
LAETTEVEKEDVYHYTTSTPALLYLFGEVGFRIEVDRGMLSAEADENALIF